MSARIYPVLKSSARSVNKFAEMWSLEYVPARNARYIEPVMGWISSSDTLASQIKIYFHSKSAALDYAEKRKISFELIDRKPLNYQHQKYYTNNFKK